MVRKQDGRLGRQQGVLNDGPHSLAELADARRRMVAELPDPQLGVGVVLPCSIARVVRIASHGPPDADAKGHVRGRNRHCR